MHEGFRLVELILYHTSSYCWSWGRVLFLKLSLLQKRKYYRKYYLVLSFPSSLKRQVEKFATGANHLLCVLLFILFPAARGWWLCGKWIAWYLGQGNTNSSVHEWDR